MDLFRAFLIRDEMDSGHANINKSYVSKKSFIKKECEHEALTTGIRTNTIVLTLHLQIMLDGTKLTKKKAYIRLGNWWKLVSVS